MGTTDFENVRTGQRWWLKTPSTGRPGQHGQVRLRNRAVVVCGFTLHHREQNEGATRTLGEYTNRQRVTLAPPRNTS
jgi:hypothetical protein